MITTPTVFVLGAGASIPYGFPSGKKLRALLCDREWARRFSRDLVAEIGVDLSMHERFQEVFLRSSLFSIDAFLSRRSEFAEVGKIFIALELCALEVGDSVLSLNIEDDWYKILWNAMASNAHILKDLSKNQVRLISFNYDRSLEHFLHETTKNTFGVSDDDAQNTLQSIPIIHLYGTLGKYDFSHHKESRIYHPGLDRSSIRLAANGIRVIPETRKDDEVFLRARACFEWAERICFLGFGFDPINIQRLGLVDVLDWKQSKGKHIPTIFASVLDLKKGEIDSAGGALCGSHTPHWHPGNPKWNSSETLREFGLHL